MNKQRILEKVLETGLSSAAGEVSDQVIYRLILLLGLSTAFLINYFSGRGVRHSFPTRRSSDLRRAMGIDLLRMTQARDHGDDADAVTERILDRKSTRLNSSHRCISYAVFCLKKKRNIVIEI